jgi:4-hydroxybenzoate polyprenyltransferase
VWLAGVLTVCSVAVVPHPVLVGISTAGWLVALACFVLWQAALVWLVCRASPLPAGTDPGPSGQAPR